jgi:leucyl aminopeptidase
MNGKTIEVIDTDAEGRMVLADTLCLASRDNPNLMLDFATLTGACVRAISTRYSGAFSNTPAFYPRLIELGQKSGERIWPFPLDEDFFEGLDSEIADTKQCREKGGVDHIEAAIFLKKFVDPKIPWIHLDLSSAENNGGLAHVPTTYTGFGVRIALSIIESFLQPKKEMT